MALKLTSENIPSGTLKKITFAGNVIPEGTLSYSEYSEKIGFLYNYTEAKQACPEGWRLPKKADIEQLISAADRMNENPGNTMNMAGAYLRGSSKTRFKGTDEKEFIWGVNDPELLNKYGLDEFNALPTGHAQLSEPSVGVEARYYGYLFSFWVDAENNDPTKSARFRMPNDQARATFEYEDLTAKTLYFPIRCVKAD